MRRIVRCLLVAAIASAVGGSSNATSAITPSPISPTTPTLSSVSTAASLQGTTATPATTQNLTSKVSSQPPTATTTPVLLQDPTTAHVPNTSAASTTNPPNVISINTTSDNKSTLNSTLTFTLGAICGILVVVIAHYAIKYVRDRRRQSTPDHVSECLSPSYAVVVTPNDTRPEFPSRLSSPKRAVLGPEAEVAPLEYPTPDFDMDSPMSDSSGMRSSSDLECMDSTRYEDMVRMKINIF
ncbi:hypothetical protein ACHHYP_03701 [Achlya hypogyna]|uniref:Secreted protein n=1 Tax=Achlya hypogyna TaxID=1202772 RepID=A0A1V9Z357_ACHHY|nr:hypothetical protein ACHHYP_03701 [Achlya hypogyna]